MGGRAPLLSAGSGSSEARGSPGPLSFSIGVSTRSRMRVHPVEQLDAALPDALKAGVELLPFARGETPAEDPGGLDEILDDGGEGADGLDELVCQHAPHGASREGEHRGESVAVRRGGRGRASTSLSQRMFLGPRVYRQRSLLLRRH